MGGYLRDNMGCMADFGYVILETNLLIAPTGRRFGTNRRPAQWAISINQLGRDRVRSKKKSFFPVIYPRLQPALPAPHEGGP